MTTSTARALARRTGRLLCCHLGLAMACAALVGASPADGCRPALYLLWAALPLSAASWAAARAHEKRRLRRDRAQHLARPDDWEAAA